MEGQIEKSHKEYMEFDPNIWVGEFFDDETGGYVIVNLRRRANADKSKNEREKYEKELNMSMVFARNGYAIKMLEEIPRIVSPDVTINGVLADLKNITYVRNIVKHARKAVKIQGAVLVLFQFEEMTPFISEELGRLSRMGIHGKYFISRKDIVLDF